MKTRKDFLGSAANLFRGLKYGQLCFIGKNVSIGRNTKIREMAIIEDNVTIGPDSFIGVGCIIRPETTIGRNFSLGHYSVLEGCTYVGSNVRIHAQVHLSKGTSVYSNTFIAPFTVTTNTKKMSHGRFSTALEGVIIKEGCRIGVACVILPGVTIGIESVIGARSLVTKDIPNYSIAYGAPAKVVGEVPLGERIYS